MAIIYIMESTPITITIKYKTESFKIQVKKEATILEVKTMLESNLKAPATNQKLIYNGILINRKNT